ncbi:MAG: flagellar hook-basal body complex protein FliE [Armatimonadota bacterium]
MRIATNPAIQSALETGALGAPQKSSEGTPLAGTKGSDFAQQLMDVLGEVNGAQTKAASLQTDLTTGRRPVEVHDVMIAMEKASIAMQLTLAVRNKVMEAYQEISRMQV